MSIGLVLLIVLIIILLGGFPTGGYGFGHPLNGGIGLVIIVIIILLLIGRI